MTDRIMEWLDESQRLADQATEGPWTWGDAAHGSPTNGPTHHEVRARGGMVAETDYDIHGALDAEFIAESRIRLPQAVATLREVAKLHQPSPYSYSDGSTPCKECNRSDSTGLNPTWWPCPTLRAITNALGLEGDNDEHLG